LANRSRHEIYASVLKSAARNGEGTRITRIMYESLLSYTMISRDLKELVKAGLLVNLPDITSYKITDKGLKFLELSEKMNDLINF
jgi:predicted transcriptional regulator